MTRSLRRALLSILLATSLPAIAADGNVDLPRFPSISPDGSEIVFSWRGDLWKVDAAGGAAVRLTSHPADELQSAWSPDGTRIAFTSTRTGSDEIFVMQADGTGIQPVTDTDRSCDLTAFGRLPGGGETILFSAALEGDTYRSARPYRIDPAGGDMLRVHDAFGDHPVASPDGTRIAFTRGGASWRRRGYRGADQRDVWLWTASDGSFRRLTTWEGNDGQARWAGPDALVFLSDRELDRVNLYRMDAGRGGRSAKRLTGFRDRDVQALDVSADGTIAVLMAWDTLYTLDLTTPGAKPAALTILASEDERDLYEVKKVDREVTQAALSPDGKVMAFVAYGDIYVRNLEEKSPTRAVTRTAALEESVAWSPDGLKLYFVSDRDGTESIYAATVARTREEVKESFEEKVHPGEAGEEAGTAVEPEEDAAAAAEDEEAADDAEAGDEKKDGKAEKKELPPELDPSRWHDPLTFEVTPVVVEATNDRDPQPSPDGRWLSFRRGRGDLVLLDLESGRPRTLLESWDTGLEWRFSPDGRHIAYAVSDMDFNRDIWIAPADGSGEAVNITRHPDNDVSPRWSADGRILTFLSERVDEQLDVWRIYLDADLESYTPKELRDYYEEAKKKAKKREPLAPQPAEGDDEAAKKDTAKDATAKKDTKKEEPPVELSLDDAYLRLQRVTTLSGDEGDNALTPAADRYIFTAVVGDKRQLFSLPWDGEERTKLAENVDVEGVSLTGDKVVILSKGRAGTVPPDKEKIEYVDIAAEIRIDLEAQSSQKFLQAARTLGEQFYHPTMKGLDWDRLTREYHELAKAARTADEFNDVANRFLGELNASHLGIYASDDPSPNAQSQGRLGTDHRRVDAGFEVVAVLPESPAATGPMALQPGDVITAIEGEPFGPTDTVESRLRGRAGEETLITVRRALEDAPADLDLLLTPIPYGDERQLRYLDWRRENARQVAEWSHGRVGYIHIQAMNQPSLDVFERDLYAAAHGKDGLIIDVRNNGGGWTTDRLLSSIMVQEHAYTIPRGAPQEHGHYPQDRLFIQRYTLPINMLCNEKSFSNAEIISHAFKTLHRGTLVGQETYGAVISTGGFALIDGTFVRLPFRGWYLLDGTDMENHGAVPDLIVEQTPEDESAGEDAQLRAALDDLMKRL